MKTEKKYRDLPCLLTNDERRERGVKLAATLQEYDRVCDEKASQMARFKTKIDLLKSQLDDLATVVQTGTEYRQIEVVEEVDYKKGIAEIIRVDTGESVGQRILAEAEHQLDITMPAVRKAGEEDRP